MHLGKTPRKVHQSASMADATEEKQKKKTRNKKHSSRTETSASSTSGTTSGTSGGGAGGSASGAAGGSSSTIGNVVNGEVTDGSCQHLIAYYKEFGLESFNVVHAFFSASINQDARRQKV